MALIRQKLSFSIRHATEREVWNCSVLGACTAAYLHHVSFDVWLNRAEMAQTRAWLGACLLVVLAHVVQSATNINFSG
jgi:hypothetical protein